MKTIYFFIILIICPFFLVEAQKTATEIKGDKLFNDYSFYEAIEKYMQLETLTTQGQRNLAESYRNIGEYTSSENAYKKFINTRYAKSTDFFKYALVLRTNGKYKEADVWLKKFSEIKPKELRTESYLTTRADLPALIKDQGKFKILNLDINTPDIDFGPSFFREYIVFASSREPIPSVVRTYNWNEMPFLNLYIAAVEGNQLSEPEYFNKWFNKKWHEGTSSFSNKGSFMAFTRDDYKGKSREGIIKLQIFFSKFDGRKWSNPVPFELNNPEYSVGHPSLTEDGNTLYFSSDKPGGFGGVDIYKIQRVEGGAWGKAENLGKSVNTEGDEVFPFYEEKSKTLFFSSNGLYGLGGLDIFYSRESNGELSKAKNIGAPLNSPYDDFSLIIDKQLKKGYFSSNRVGGQGDDDIYSFQVLRSIFGAKRIIGVAKDKKGKLLADAAVSLYDDKNTLIGTVTTAANGAYGFDAEANKIYSLNGVKLKYSEGKNTANTNVPQDVIVADVIMNPVAKRIIGVAKDRSDVILAETTVSLFDNNGELIAAVVTGKDGAYGFDAEANKLYSLKGKKPNYLDGKNTANTNTPEEVIVADVILQDFKKDKLIRVDPIYFDLSKWNIRPDAALILDQIVAIMNEYPTIEIELGSHTDCRSSIAFNMALSTKRALASADYIKKRITRPERIYGKGYGESKLLNNCGCEGKVKSTCTEEEHQVNRRTEFKIIKM
jgi:outer membrane protein OmpA-like peptidoglycan-associated protein